MLHLYTPSLLFLVSCFFGAVSGLVSKDFSECSEFFYHNTPPQGITAAEYQPICQQYKNRFRFATLYNRELHAALYSAYKVSHTKTPRPDDSWMYEPQLSDMNGQPEMQLIESDKEKKESQALLLDYKGSIYSKGHLAPNLHVDTAEDKNATFTLTNILPQRGGSNSGPWAQWETKILSIKKYCNDMYVITGGVPFNPVKLMNEKVSIPEYMWSAYCCASYSTQPPEGMKALFPTHAAVGRNDPNSNEDIVTKNPNLKGDYSGYDVIEISLTRLEEILRNKLNIEVTLFYEDCKQVQR